MADIELVIKVSEDTYKDIIENGFIYDEDNEVVTYAIKNGIPLPKGHGSLVDVDKMVKDEPTVCDIEQLSATRYNNGFYDGAKGMTEKWNGRIEQIRAEIEHLHHHPKLDFIKNDEVVDMALDIIDKYKGDKE